MLPCGHPPQIHFVVCLVEANNQGCYGQIHEKVDAKESHGDVKEPGPPRHRALRAIHDVVPVAGCHVLKELQPSGKDVIKVTIAADARVAIVDAVGFVRTGIPPLPSPNI